MLLGHIVQKFFRTISNLMNKKCLDIINLVVIFAAISIYLITREKKETMSCIFCDIVNKKTNTEILFENDEFVAFRDIKPAAPYHFLIIPKKHMTNTSVLTTDDKPMLLDMKKYMLELMQKNQQIDINDISLGFHIPPFNSVRHLHLHGISKKSEMGFMARMIFRENSFWYKSFDTVFDSLPPSK